MKTLTFIEKINGSGEPIRHGDKLVIDAEKLIGTSTKSLYIRKGFLHGNLFLSQRGCGSTGAGDICPLINDTPIQEIEVNANLFMRLQQLAEKANAIIN